MFLNKKSKLFYKYFAFYIVVLMIPVLVMGIFAYRRILSILEHKIISANINTVVRIRNSVDLQLSVLEKIPIRLQFNERLKPFHIRTDPIHAIEVQRLLQNYSSTNDFINEIVYYVRDTEYMYSSSSSYTLYTFTNHIYKFKEWDYNTFYNDINTSVVPILRPAESVVNNRTTENRFITYIYPIPAKSKSPYGSILILINEKHLINMVADNLDGESSNTVLIDEKGTIISALRDDVYLTSSEFKTMQKSIIGFGSTTIVLNDIEYFVSFAKSEKTGWSYITMLPAEEALKEVLVFKTTIFYATIVILLLGGIFIYLFAYINYNPLKKLGESARFYNANEIPDNANEIETTQYVLGALSQKSDDLQKRIFNNRQAIRDYLALNLIKGVYNNIHEFNTKGDEINFSFKKTNFRVAIFHFSDDESVNKNYEQIMSEIEKNAPTSIETIGKESIETNSLIFILADDNLDDQRLEQHLYELQNLIIDKFKRTSSVAVGNSYTSTKDIGKSYIQAVSAMDYRMIVGKNKIIFFTEISNKAELKYYPKEMLEKLELSILQMDTQKISSLILGMASTIKEMQMPLCMAKCLCYDIVNTVIKTTQQMSLKLNISSKSFPDVLSLIEFQTVDQLVDITMEICYKLCLFVKQVDHKTSEIFINKIFACIDDNFHNYEFSVQGLADHFNMSISSISHYFKGSTGQTLSDYISQQRIKMAKKLLVDTDNSLKMIVDAVGYSDVSSFIKKFKKLVGATPGEYRRSKTTDDSPI